MSRTPRSFAVFGFQSTHDALAAEDVLRDIGAEVVPIPAPSSLGGRCGIALRVPELQAEMALSEIKRNEIELIRIILMDDV